MALFPLISNFHGDFVLKLVPVDTENSFAEVAEAAAAQSVGVHVAAQPGKTIRARKEGAKDPFPRDLRVKDSGLEAMDCVEFYYE